MTDRETRVNPISQLNDVVPPARLVIASRESALALWQARHVQARLAALFPHCAVSILGMTTKGDRILDKALDKIGGKGLFVKELEDALAEGRADLAVHSMKDVPMVLPEGFVMAAISEREDPRDALCGASELRSGMRIGTASARRRASSIARALVMRERFTSRCPPVIAPRFVTRSPSIVMQFRLAERATCRDLRVCGKGCNGFGGGLEV